MKKFIEEEFNKFNYSIYELNDFYGPTVLTRDVQAIVTTDVTKGNCIKINELRRSKGMPLLEIIVVPLVEDQQGKVISSTRIREGEIDINGKKLTS